MNFAGVVGKLSFPVPYFTTISQELAEDRYTSSPVVNTFCAASFKLRKSSRLRRKMDVSRRNFIDLSSFSAVLGLQFWQGICPAALLRQENQQGCHRAMAH